MLHDTPLREFHQRYVQTRAEQASSPQEADRPGAAQAQAVKPADLEYLPYGPSDQPEQMCEVVATFGEVEAEYAAIRRGAGLMDCPQRGTLLVTGEDRTAFLNSMLTNELKDLTAGTARRAFWLNRQGRIDADVTVVETGEHVLIDVDIHQAQATLESLDKFIFTEDATIKNVSDEMHRISIHGPRVLEVIAQASGDEDFRLNDGCCAKIIIADHELIIARMDVTGDIGVELFVPLDHTAAVWQRLLETDESLGKPGERVRPIGWYAFNIARIEGGTPLFNIDFGPTNLPHETGVLRERVSFTKGCYLGQEIVARMESLGKPKQTLVGLRVSSDLLPIAGAQVFAKDESGEMGDQIGVVTSSTLSPMLGASPIAFAMLKTAHAELGNAVLVNAEGEQVAAGVHALRFLPDETQDAAS